MKGRCGVYFQWNYYLTLKRKEVLSHAILWVNLEDIRLKRMPVTKRFHLCEGSPVKVRDQKVECWLPVAEGRGTGWFLNGYRVSDLHHEKVLEIYFTAM
jgi:hypothetical protein